MSSTSIIFSAKTNHREFKPYDPSSPSYKVQGKKRPGTNLAKPRQFREDTLRHSKGDLSNTEHQMQSQFIDYASLSEHMPVISQGVDNAYTENFAVHVQPVPKSSNKEPCNQIEVTGDMARNDAGSINNDVREDSELVTEAGLTLDGYYFDNGPRAPYASNTDLTFGTLKDGATSYFDDNVTTTKHQDSKLKPRREGTKVDFSEVNAVEAGRQIVTSIESPLVHCPSTTPVLGSAYHDDDEGGLEAQIPPTALQNGFDVTQIGSEVLMNPGTVSRAIAGNGSDREEAARPRLARDDHYPSRRLDDAIVDMDGTGSEDELSSNVVRKMTSRVHCPSRWHARTAADKVRTWRSPSQSPPDPAAQNENGSVVDQRQSTRSGQGVPSVVSAIIHSPKSDFRLKMMTLFRKRCQIIHVTEISQDLWLVVGTYRKPSNLQNAALSMAAKAQCSESRGLNETTRTELGYYDNNDYQESSSSELQEDEDTSRVHLPWRESDKLRLLAYRNAETMG